MKRKVTGYRLQLTVLILISLAAALLILPTTIRQLADQLPTTAFAQQACVPQTENPRVGGLISAPDLIASKNKFSNATGVCVIDPKAAFIPFRIPTYAELESLYFDQSKLPPTQKIIINEDNQSLIDLSDT